jgi:hypothetical protein
MKTLNHRGHRVTQRNYGLSLCNSVSSVVKGFA